MRSLPLLFAGALVPAVIALVIFLTGDPPAARGLEAPATDFSALRALEQVRAIAVTPHPVGSRAHDEVRDHLVGVLTHLGLAPRIQDERAALRIAGSIHGARVENVIAKLPGSRGGGPAVLLVAHYDSVAQSPGASDDGAGVATLLETARALRAGPPLANDVVFLFSDAEEIGLVGAFAFRTEELAKEPVGIALNFDARGTGGSVGMYDTTENNGALLHALAAAASHPVATSLLGVLAHALPNDSDATVFMRAGIPTYAFAYGDHVFQYHSRNDSAEALDPRSLQHEGDYALPLVRALGMSSLPLPASPDVAYFDVFGTRGGPLVVYATSTARILAVLTLALLFALAWKRVTVRGLVAGSALAVAALVAGTAAAAALHALVSKAGDPFTLLARPGMLSSACVCAAGSAWLGAYTLALRAASRLQPAAAALGGMAVWGAILGVVALIAPAASFAFQWPLLAAVAGAAAWLKRGDAPSAVADISTTLSFGVSAFFIGNLAYALFVLVGANLPEALAFAVVLALLLAVPALARLRGGERRTLFWASLVAGAALTVTAAVSSRHATHLPRPDTLDFALGATTAKWTTDERPADAFVRQRIPAGESSNDASRYDLAPPQIATDAVEDGDVRRVTLGFTLPPGTRCLRVWDDGGEAIQSTRIDGNPVPDLTRRSPATDALMNLLGAKRAASKWGLSYCGAEGSLRVELETRRGGSPIKLTGYAMRDGLPGPPLTPRGSGAYPSQYSDATFLWFDIAK
jgi:hypothetical protein